MDYFLTQIIGAIAYVVLAISYFEKRKKGILIVHIIALTAFSIYYYLLDGLTGAICNVIELVALIAIYLFDKYELKNKKLLTIGMIPIIIIIASITFKDIFSIFPIVACSVTILSFLAKEEITIRGMGIVSTVCWLVYAVALKSLISMLFETVTLISVTVAFARYFLKTRQQ